MFGRSVLGKFQEGDQMMQQEVWRRLPFRGTLNSQANWSVEGVNCVNARSTDG
jgi:hypothetical protein